MTTYPYETSSTQSNPAVRVYVWLIRGAIVLQSIFLLAIRLTWGKMFFDAGKGKLGNIDAMTRQFAEWKIPFPHLNVILASTTEMVGGALLMAGFAARLISIPLTCTMLVAYWAADREALHDMDKFVQATPFPFLFTVLVVLCFGPGKISVDYLIQRFALKRTDRDNAFPLS